MAFVVFILSKWLKLVFISPPACLPEVSSIWVHFINFSPRNIIFQIMILPYFTKVCANRMFNILLSLLNYKLENVCCLNIWCCTTEYSHIFWKHDPFGFDTWKQGQTVKTDMCINIFGMLLDEITAPSQLRYICQDRKHT